MRAVSKFLLLLAVAHTAAIQDCKIEIRRTRVLNSWQSSFGNGPTCFHNRTESEEAAVLSKPSSSYRFFHSGDGSAADGGFHWFAVQLSEPLLISSVTLKGREYGKSFTYSRTRGIEVWTAGSSRVMLSGDHCSSRSMSSQFRESRWYWRLCGVTDGQQRSIRAGETLTVNCTQDVRYLLLRRDVRTADPSMTHDFMSFADLSLQTMELKVSSPEETVRNDNVSVSCSLHCKGTKVDAQTKRLKLCSPRGSCTASNAVHIPRIQSEDSGSYTCKIGTSKDGYVSRWVFPTDDVKRLDISSAIITCSAVQSFPKGIRIQAVHTDSTFTSCCSGSLVSTVLVLHIAMGFCFGFIAAAASAAAIRLRMLNRTRPDSCGSAGCARRRPTAGRPAAGGPAAPQSASEYENSEYKLENATGIYIL
uniref:Ig-like domain-containing protein n=1 Tax=Macrostomum lignano TaxID=282301 RepID=A0A1I8H7P4_9PLAT